MTTIARPSSPSLSYVLTYDAWNRVTKVEATTGYVFGVYEYDGQHHRIVKDAEGTANDREFYYNDKWQVLTETKEGAAHSIYAWHPYYIDALAVRFRELNQHVFLHDANFNVVAAYDVKPTSGTYRQVVERYQYTPYGEVTFLNPDFSLKAGQFSAIDNNYLYTGRERDPETGLQLNRNRFLHAPLGRWTSQDPIGYWGGDENLYNYVGNMPTGVVDPSGLRPAVAPPISRPGRPVRPTPPWPGRPPIHRPGPGEVLPPGNPGPGNPGFVPRPPSWGWGSPGDQILPNPIDDMIYRQRWWNENGWRYPYSPYEKQGELDELLGNISSDPDVREILRRDLERLTRTCSKDEEEEECFLIGSGMCSKGNAGGTKKCIYSCPKSGQKVKELNCLPGNHEGPPCPWTINSSDI